MRILVRWTPHRDGQRDQEEVHLQDPPHTVNDLLEHLKEPPEGVLCVRGETPIPLDTPLVDGEQILLVRTVSGG